MKYLCCVCRKSTDWVNSPFLPFPSTIDAGDQHKCDYIHGKKRMKCFCNLLINTNIFLKYFIFTKFKKWGGCANQVIFSPCNFRSDKYSPKKSQYLPFCKFCSVVSKGINSSCHGEDTVFVDWCL